MKLTADTFYYIHKRMLPIPNLYFSNFLKSMNIHTGVIIVFWSSQLQFRPFRLIIVFLTRVPRCVTLVEQELPSLPVHLSSCPMLVGFMASDCMPNVSGVRGI